MPAPDVRPKGCHVCPPPRKTRPPLIAACVPLCGLAMLLAGAAELHGQPAPLPVLDQACLPTPVQKRPEECRKVTCDNYGGLCWNDNEEPDASRPFASQRGTIKPYDTCQPLTGATCSMPPGKEKSCLLREYFSAPGCAGPATCTRNQMKAEC